MTLKTDIRVLTMGDLLNGESLLEQTRLCQTNATQTKSNLPCGDMNGTWTYSVKCLSEMTYRCLNFWKF